MVKELREKLDLPIKHLHNMEKKINNAHDMFKNSSGFGWDPETNVFKRNLKSGNPLLRFFFLILHALSLKLFINMNLSI